MIHSDYHIHTTASYDAHLPLEILIARAKEQGLRQFGVTDHANYNDAKFMGNLRQSAENFRRLRHLCPNMILGVELTAIAKPQFDYIARTGTREGYVPVPQDKPYDIELAATKDELRALGVVYAVGAAHWRVDVADVKAADNSRDAQIREWHRQQMYLAADERCTILGHPWTCNSSWYEDFTIIPRGMIEDELACLKQYGKYIECNVSVFTSARIPEKFRRQYAEYLREAFEKGIPVTYGSDCHGAVRAASDYPDQRPAAEKYLAAAGFRDGDIAGLDPAKLWEPLT